MPKPATILVSALVVVLIVTSAGCIEQKDPPEEGAFTITMETEVVRYAFQGEASDLHGPHAEVETDLHHKHPEYSWSIEGMADVEGSDAHIDGGPVGLREATYHLEYYEQEAHVAMVLATVPNATSTYVVVVELPSEEGNATGTTELEIEPTGNLVAIHNDSMGRVLANPNEMGVDNVALNVSLDPGAEGEVTYVVAFQIGVGGMNAFRTERALVIHPGLHHHIDYGSGNVIVSVANTSTPDQPFQEDLYEELPSSYVAHPGQLEWEGEVGEAEEVPGFGLLVASTALFATAAIMVRRLQST